MMLILLSQALISKAATTDTITPDLQRYQVLGTIRLIRMTGGISSNIYADSQRTSVANSKLSGQAPPESNANQAPSDYSA